MKIKLLSQKAINAINSGTTIASPEFAFKELLENAIDSGANLIQCELLRGGRTLISVSDNGEGMSREDLPLAVARHATSKLIDEDVSNITQLGFRGEALHAIASCSLIQITTRQPGAEQAWCIANKIQAGANGEVLLDFAVSPAARNPGTTVEVRDIFCLSPNRLRFLKSESAEVNACFDLLQRFALAYPEVAFTLRSNGKQLAKFNPNSSHSSQENSTLLPDGVARFAADRSQFASLLLAQEEPENYLGLLPLKMRINEVFGEDFIENSVFVCEKRNGISLYGFANVPTHHRVKAKSNRIFCYVNGRAVKDNLLNLLVKTAYNAVLPIHYSPNAVLYFEMAPHMVDVNVHPNKTQVRFADEAQVRGLVIGALKRALSRSQVTSRITEHFALGFSNQVELSPENSANLISNRNFALQFTEEDEFFSRNAQDAPIKLSNIGQNYDFIADFKQDSATALCEEQAAPRVSAATRGETIGSAWFTPQYISPIALASCEPRVLPLSVEASDIAIEQAAGKLDLGQPLCQLHNRYIIASNGRELILVDQHAVHERYVLEQFKKARSARGIASQQLVIPEVLEFTSYEVQELLARREEMARLGFFFQNNPSSDKSIIISAIPEIFPLGLDIYELFLKILDDIAVFSEITLHEMDKILGEIACYSSVRAGKKLDLRSMERILRMVENTDFAAQCNHGRPTYITLPLSYIDKLFERL